MPSQPISLCYCDCELLISERNTKESIAVTLTPPIHLIILISARWKQQKWEGDNVVISSFRSMPAVLVAMVYDREINILQHL